MTDAFDPYYTWLGIPPKDQPPNHYRLLGLELFEANLDVIESATFRQMGHVRTYQNGPHAAESQQVLNALSAAQIHLLNREKKAVYDQALRGSIKAETEAQAAKVPVVLPESTMPRTPAVATSVPTKVVKPSRDTSGDAPTVGSSAARPNRPKPATRIAIAIGVAVAAACIGVIVMFGSLFLQSDLPVVAQSAPSSTEPAVKTPDPSTTTPPEKPTTSGDASPPTSPTNPTSPADPEALPDQGGPKVRISSAPASKPVSPLNESAQQIRAMPDPMRLRFLEFPLDGGNRLRIESAGGIVTKEFVMTQTLPYDDLLHLVATFRNLGYRPLRLRPFTIDGATHVATAWTRDAVDWRIAIGVSAIAIRNTDELLASRGFQPVDVASWQADDTKFSAIWVADPEPAKAHQLMLDVPHREFATAVEDARARGFIPKSHHSYSDPLGERHYNVVWYQPDKPLDWHHWDRDRESHELLLNSPGAFQDVCLGYEATGKLTYGALLVDRPDADVLELHGFAADEHRTQCQDLAAKGYRPIAIAAAARDGSGRVITASVWQLGGPSSARSRGPSNTTASSNSPPNTVAAKATHALRLGGGSVKVSNSQGLAAQQKAFTAEIWFRLTETSLQKGSTCLMGNAVPMITTNSSTASGWYVSVGNRDGSPETYRMRVLSAHVSGRMHAHERPIPPLGNDWHHLAICSMPRGPISQFAVFLDGRRIQMINQPIRAGMTDPGDFWLGSSGGLPNENAFPGDIKAFRLSSNVRYRSSFTPAQSFSSDSATLVLFNFDSADAGMLSDASGNNRSGVIDGASWIKVDAPANSLAASVPASTDSSPSRALLPAPSKEDRLAGSKRVKDIFAAELDAAQDKATKLALAKDFANRAATEQDELAKFALLYESRELSLAAIDVPSTMQTTVALSDAFKVDPWALKCDALTRLAATTRSNDERSLIASTALLLAEEAISNSDWNSASTFVSAALKANLRLKDRDVLRSASQKRKQIEAFKKLWEEAERANEKLASSPDDGPANLKLGRYHCFVKDDWKKGLAHLAKGSDTELAKLAVDDARQPQGREALTLANGWYAWGENATEGDQTNVLLRARHWYSVALPQLSGLDRTVALKKLDQLDLDVSSITKKLSWLEGQVGILKRLEGHTAPVTSFDVSRDGRMLVSGSTDRTVRFWDLVKGTETGQITSSVGNISKVRLIRDDRFVLVIGSQSTAEIWNARTKKPATALTVPAAIRDSELSADNKILVCSVNSSSPGNITIYNMVTGVIAGQLNCPAYPYTLAVSSTGRLVAAGGSDQNVYIWNLATLKMAAPFRDVGQTASDLAISPDERLVVASTTSHVVGWGLANGKVRWRLPVPPVGVTRLAFSPDSRHLLAAGMMNEITVINTKDGTIVQQLKSSGRGSRSAYGEVAYLPDPRGAVSAGYDGTIRIWRVTD